MDAGTIDDEISDAVVGDGDGRRVVAKQDGFRSRKRLEVEETRFIISDGVRNSARIIADLAGRVGNRACYRTKVRSKHGAKYLT